METATDIHYRYPGTKPFGADESLLFNGRDTDIENLYDMVSLQDLIVLFGRSGLGKSSLLNAGLINRFKDQQTIAALTIRFGAFYTGNTISPLEKLNTVIETVNDSTADDDFYKKVLGAGHLENPGLWYRFKSQQAVAPDKAEFVLIFDQFEELFTYPENEITVFKKALAELLFETVPQEIRDIIKDKLVNDKSYFSREEINLLLTPMNIKVLFSIRSDKLGLLNGLTDYFPQVLKNCYELKPLSREQARQAIEQPAMLTDKAFECGPFSFSAECINLILDALTVSKTAEAAVLNTTKQDIETFQLQIVCSYVEQLVIKNNLKEINAVDLGNIKEIFENHYRNIIDKIPVENRLAARQLIEEKLVIDGLRVSMPVPFILRDKGMTKQLLDDLISTHILRPAENNTVEISHDTLIEPILKYYNERKKQEAIETELEEKELEIKRIKAEREETFKKQQQERELETQKLKARRNRLMFTTVSIALIFTSGLAYFAWTQKQKAMANEKAAITEKQAFMMISKAQSKVHTDPTVALKYADSAIAIKQDSIFTAIKNRIAATNIFYKNIITTGSETLIRILDDGTKIITGNKDGTDSLFSVNGKLLKTFKQQGQLRAAEISKDGKTIVTGSTNGYLEFWDIDATTPKATVKSDSAITTVLFSPDQKTILTRSEDNLIKLWGLDGSLIKQLPGIFICASFSADGTKIITGSEDGIPRLWDTKGLFLKSFRAAEEWNGAIMSVAFSPDGTKVLEGRYSGIATIWDITNEKKPLARFVNIKSVSNVIFGYTGKESNEDFFYVYIGCYNGLINIWRIDINKDYDEKGITINYLPVQVQELKGHTESVNLKMTAPFTVLTSSRDGTAKAWDMQPFLQKNFRGN